MSFVLALDQGTTSSRSILFDETGSAGRHGPAGPRRSTSRDLDWVEHDATEIWDSQLATAREALDRGRRRARGRRRRSASPTSARRSSCGTAASGEPIHHAVVWQDRRTADVCARLKAEGHEPAVRARTGLVLDPYFSGTKLAWVLDHVQGARGRAEAGELAFGTVDSWLLWKLTGGRVHATDVTNALADAALRPPRARLERRAAGAPARAARRAPGRPTVVGPVR